MTDRPKRFLFVMWEGGGVVPPELSLASRLSSRGHSVRILADPSIERDANSRNVPWVSFQSAPHRFTRTAESDFIKDWEPWTPIGKLSRLRDRLMCGPSLDYAKDVRRELEREPVDVLVSDWMILGALVAAESLQIPSVALMPTIYMPPVATSVKILGGYRPPVGLGLLPARSMFDRARHFLVYQMIDRMWNQGTAALNRTRESFNLPPVSALFDQLNRSERVLVLTSAAFDFPCESFPSNVRYVGALSEDPVWAAEWKSPLQDDPSTPLVVVTYSTMFQGQGTMIQLALDALADLPVRGLVTVGPSIDPAAFRPPPNVVVVASAPHGRVFPMASLIVTHAGHGTVLKAVSAGVPVICQPGGADQLDNSARIEARGAGLRVRPNASSRELRAAIKRVITDKSFKERAMRMAHSIASSASQCADAIEELERMLEGIRAPALAPDQKSF